MRSFALFIFLLLPFSFPSLAAQQADSIIVLQLLSAGDSGAFRNCEVRLEEDRAFKRMYYSDEQGIVKISAKGILNRYYDISIEQKGESLACLYLDSLPLNDTFIVLLPHVLDGIQIVRYMVPVIEKDPRWWQKKEKPVVFVRDTIYSADTLAKIEQLKRGEWNQTDTGHGVITQQIEFYKYFRNRLNYPASAYNNEIQGIVVFEFMLDKDEKISMLKLVYSDDPSLALAVVAVFKHMPALKFLAPEMISVTTHFNDERVIEGHRRPDMISFVEAKPSVYRISVYFSLR